MAKSTFAFFGVLALLVFSLGLVSATSSIYLDVGNVSAPTSVDEDAGSFTFTFDVAYTKDGDENATIDFSNSTSNFGSVSISSITLNGTANESQTVSGTVTGFSNQGGNDLEAVISVSTSTYKDNETSFNVTINSVDDPHNFCGSDFNTSEIEIKYIKDKSSGDDWEWKPLDEIEVEVKVENNGEDDEDYDIELIFLDDGDNDVSDEIVEDDDDLLEEDVEIESDKNEEITFNFAIDGEVDADDYRLFAVVSRSGQCNFQEAEEPGEEIEIDIKKSSHDVIVREVEGPSNLEAGSTMAFEVKISNIGSKDEERVKIIAYNSALGINVQKEIEDLDEGDSETLTFNIQFPSSVDEKLYKIRFSTEFDYDEDDEKFTKWSESSEDILWAVTVLGGEYKEPSITASLLSTEAAINSEVAVQISVTNNGADGNYVVSAEDFESWAELLAVEPQVLDLNKGETQKVTIKLKPTKTGIQMFNVKTTVSGEETLQTVSLDITGEPGFLDSFKENGTMLYVIAGIAAVLILIILVLIVRVSSGSRTTTEF
jgi:hypothetical protein